MSEQPIHPFLRPPHVQSLPPLTLDDAIRIELIETPMAGELQILPAASRAEFNFDFNFQVPAAELVINEPRPGTFSFELDYSRPANMAIGVARVPTCEEIGNITILLQELANKVHFEIIYQKLLKLDPLVLATLSAAADQAIREQRG